MNTRRVLFALLLAALLAPAAALAQNSNPVRFSTEPASPCPGDSVKLRVDWCSNCTELIHAGRDPQNGALIVEVRHFSNDSCGVNDCWTVSDRVPLGVFMAGHYQTVGTLIVHRPGSNVPEISSFFFSFDVRRDCGPSPPLPFVNSVQIRGIQGGPPCDDDSLVIELSGMFPNECHRLRAVQVMELLCIVPCAPVIQLLFDDGGCLGAPCPPQATLWEKRLVLHGLPAFDLPYSLRVEASVRTCSDSFPNPPDASQPFQFFVRSDSACGDPPPPGQCMVTKWSDGVPDHCDALISPDRDASLTFKIQSSADLGGLQGRFVVQPLGLRIVDLETIGAAAGMNLSWAQTPGGGASFVLFSKDGSAIPAMAPSYFDTLGLPILRLRVEAAHDAIAPVTIVRADHLLGATPAGDGVYPCPIPANVRMVGGAAVCLDRPCDANGDNVSDVRDLVRMVNCLHDTSCTGATFDCDRSGDFTIADVVCCALAILRHGAPHDSGEARPPVEVGATLGLPVVSADGLVSLPVTVRNASSLGAAMLRLSFPSADYTLEGVETPFGPGRLALHTREGNEVALALVRIPGAMRTGEAGVLEPDDATFTLRLRPLPGAEGGAVELLDGQFAAMDGSRLAVDVTPASMPIVPPTRATLSAARPNPFGRETRFSVDLPGAANVEVTVHDLSGRRVAVLFKGDLPAGRRDFTWSGAAERGGRAANGVYFVRLAAAGEVVSRKVVVLRAP